MVESLGPVPVSLVPGFEILELLGEGGMGVVYKARQVAMDRVVALKILRDELAQEPEYIRRFLREARMAGKLRHANIVSALDCGQSDGRYYMVMEFVEGQSLHRFLRSKGAMSETEALGLASGIAEALRYAWSHRVIHRDLKPQNILLTKEGVPKICDLGLCRDVRDLPHLTSLGLIHCTPEYASPEQARGDKDIDIRADLYSLGVTLYEMLTGVLPFNAADPATMILKHAMDRPRPPVERRPTISPRANQLVIDLLEKAREERPASPSIVIDRIKTILTQGGGERATSRRGNTRSWRQTARAGKSADPGSPRLLIAGLLAVGLLAMGFVLFSRGAHESRRSEAARGRPAHAPEAAPSPEPTMEDLRNLDLSRFLHAFEPREDGSVDHWLVLGPLPSPDDRGFDLPVIRQVERALPTPGLEFARADGSLVKWIRREASAGLLDFSELEGWKDEAPPYTALAACWIECREELSVEIRFSSSGDYELQLDRRVLSDARARPGTPPDPLRQRITLGRGWHSLLVKAGRAEGKLSLQLRVLTPAGVRPPGVKVWQ